MLLAFAYFWLGVIIIGWLTIIIQCCYSFYQKSESLVSRIQKEEIVPVKIDRIEQNNRLQNLKLQKLNKSQDKIIQDAREWK